MEWKVVLSCEHASHHVPSKWNGYFDDPALLLTHRGYDIGVLPLAKHFAKALNRPLYAGNTSRLLVELNRSLHSTNLFSSITRKLNNRDKNEILQQHYYPYRNSVTQAIAEKIKKGFGVVHLSIHTFTPILNGHIRTAEVSFLYDPVSHWEKTLSVNWQRTLNEVQPTYRVRRNYPYRGTSDCFCVALRRLFGIDNYVGIELEVNNKLLCDSNRPKDIFHLHHTLAESFTTAFNIFKNMP